ncbi:hypothetical protein C808_00831 [Lachnospiraceae bacterium M18-1]|nr:hypothetical protein C808_00831 [Lachnospiraceae bacterium M18-1]
MCKVSIIVPTYNVVPYIAECMDSLVNQTLKEIEILCVDAASADGTREVLESYAAKDARVKILDDIMHSTGYAKNIGIEAAQGEYIGIVESDDYVALDTYEQLYGCAVLHHPDIVKGNYKAFSGNGRERIYALKAVSLNKEDYNHIIDLQDEGRYFLWDMYTWTGIYKKSFLKDYEIRHNESPGASFQDVGFWLQTTAFAKTAYLLPGYFYHYRRDNPYSSVHQSNKVWEMVQEYKFGMKRIAGKLVRKGVSDSAHDAADQIPQDIQTVIPKKMLAGICNGMYRSYAFVYGILADEHREAFAEHFCRDMKRAFEKQWIERSLFTDEEWSGVKKAADSPEVYHAYCREIEETKERNQKALFRMIERYGGHIIFGAGSDGSNLYAFLKTKHIEKTIAFSDNAKEKWGLDLNGIKVIEPKEIREKYPNTLVITASKLYSGEIRRQLLELGIKEEDIYLCDVGTTIPQYL